MCYVFQIISCVYRHFKSVSLSVFLSVLFLVFISVIYQFYMFLFLFFIFSVLQYGRFLHDVYLWHVRCVQAA